VAINDAEMQMILPVDSADILDFLEIVWWLENWNVRTYK